MRFDTGYSDIFGGGHTQYETNTVELLSYLSVPISISRQIHLDKKGKHRMILCAGINYSYLLKATAEGYSVVVHTPAGASEPEKSYIQTNDPMRTIGYYKWDFSLHVGGGYRFQLNEDLGFGIDYRYLNNFNNTNERRLRYDQFDSKSGKNYRYSPRMNNQPNHVLSVGIFVSPRLFLGLEE